MHLLVIVSAYASQSRRASARKIPAQSLSTLVCSVWIEAATRGSPRKRKAHRFLGIPDKWGLNVRSGAGEGLWLTNDVRVRVTNAQVSIFAPPYRWLWRYQRYGGVDEETPDKLAGTIASLVADTSDAGVWDAISPTMWGRGRTFYQRCGGAERPATNDAGVWGTVLPTMWGRGRTIYRRCEGAGKTGAGGQFLLKKRYFPAQTFPDIASFVASGRGLLG